MTVLVHYENDLGPQIYTIVAITRDEMVSQLESFKEKSGITDGQFTLEIGQV